jgi:ABC-type lipoprotein export system ATPase subunit
MRKLISGSGPLSSRGRPRAEADGPTGNLDPDKAVIVLDALRQYADAGAAVLTVTHDPQAAQRAHRVLHMERGRLI